jgi:hypothetical protein
VQQIFTARKHDVPQVSTAHEHDKTDSDTEHSLSACMSTLIGDCQQDYPAERPTSIQILDRLKKFLEPAQPHWLLTDAMRSLLHFNGLDTKDHRPSHGSPCVQPEVLCAMLLQGYPLIDPWQDEAQQLLSDATKIIQHQSNAARDVQPDMSPTVVPPSHLAVAEQLVDKLSRNVQRSSRRDGFRLLSIDDGGVKGFAALLSLRAVMQRLMKNGDNMYPNMLPKPCDHFDMMIGTGTGG